LSPHVAKPIPKPAPLNKQTIKQLQAMTREAPLPPTPAPDTPAPTPLAANTAPPPLPSAPMPVPRAASPIIPEAPTPQPSQKPAFNTSSNTANDAIQRAIRDGARSRGGDSGQGYVHTSKGADAGGGVEVLSDMQGVDFSAYLRRMHDDLLRNWIPLLPEETESPIFKKGETYILLTVLPDGKIGDMRLEGSTHDTAIDKAAWGSIISEGQFPPLPSQFHGPNLVLRWHYVVNGER